MPVIHRVRVNFNIPGHSYSTTKIKSEENPPYENTMVKEAKQKYMWGKLKEHEKDQKILGKRLKC